MLQRCSENVQHQLPNTRQRVKYIFDIIDCEDSGVQAALSSIRINDVPDGHRNQFEAAAALLLPTDMVPNKIK